MVLLATYETSQSNVITVRERLQQRDGFLQAHKKLKKSKRAAVERTFVFTTEEV